MKILALIPLVMLTGCASKPEIAKVPDSEVHAMTRSEVVAAINECETYEIHHAED